MKYPEKLQTQQVKPLHHTANSHSEDEITRHDTPSPLGERDTVCVCFMRSDDVRELVVLQEVINRLRSKTEEKK